MLHYTGYKRKTQITHVQVDYIEVTNYLPDYEYRFLYRSYI